MGEKTINDKTAKYSAAQQASHMLKYYIINYIYAYMEGFFYQLEFSRSFMDINISWFLRDRGRDSTWHCVDTYSLCFNGLFGTEQLNNYSEVAAEASSRSQNMANNF